MDLLEIEKKHKKGFRLCMPSTLALVLFLIISIVLVFIVGVLGYMFLEGHPFSRAIGKTCIAIADRERDHDKINHAIFAPIFYLMVAILQAVIVGIIGAEVAKRFLSSSPSK